MKKCSKCFEYKSSSGYCKKCNGEYQLKYYYIKKQRPKINICDKHCNLCKQYLKVINFSRKCSSNDGYQSICKDCENKKRGRKYRLKPRDIFLTKEQCSYLAGLIDGEGHITLVKAKRSSGKFQGSHYVWARMSIGITHPILYDIQKEYSFGNIVLIKSKNKKHKDLISWNISSNDMRTILPQIIPYLRVRKNQAELILNYLTLATRKDKTQEYREKVDKIYEEIKILNKRGL